jgi:hypothetical protein
MGKRFRNVVLGATVLAAFVPVLHAALPAQAASPTVVALTFDEGWANQAAAVPMLDAHGMKATFYVNSGNIDQPGWLTWSQLVAFQNDGQEIGGHTLNNTNLNLPLVAPDTAQNEVCEDRGRLMKHGLNVTSFSYPFGEYYLTPAGLAAVTDCGYNSARDQYGLYDPNPAHCPNNDGCGYPYASALPLTSPATDFYKIPTATNVDSTTTLAELEGFVTRAQVDGGGLVPFVFHQICNGCDTYSTSPAVFSQFLDWLQTQAGNGTTVETMNTVVGGTMSASPGTADTTAPTSTIQCGQTACAPSYAEGITVPVSFTSSDEVGGSGVDAVRYTLDGTTPTIDSPVYTGPFNVTYNTTVNYAAWDNAGNVQAMQTQTIAIPDTTAPVSTIACNGGPCDGWHGAGTQVSLSASDAASGVKEIRYTTDGSAPTITSPVYTGPFPLSATTTVNYFAVDNANNVETAHSQSIAIDPIAPTVTVQCNGGPCTSAWHNTATVVTFAAADTGGSGVASVRYTLDGSTPSAASAAYSAPLSLTTTKTVTFRAYDGAGNSSAVTSIRVNVDTVKPTISVKAPGVLAQSTGMLRITAKASDTQSKVTRVYFYIDRKFIRVDSKAPFTFAWSTRHAKKGLHILTVKAFDAAGNVGVKVITFRVR